MGTVGGNGGGWPPDSGGPPEGFPEIPPEWGEIVIPDSPAALAEEAEEVRRELAQRQRRDRWRQLLGQPPGTEPAGAAGGLRAPLLIMVIAVLVTVASLFAATWPGQSRPAPQRSAGTVSQIRTLPAIELLDTAGTPVPLRGNLPAVVLLVDGCDCAALTGATATATQPGVAVIAVAGPASPAVPPTTGDGRVQHLIDPAGGLRGSLGLGPPDGTAAVLLVDHAGEIVRTYSRTASVEDFRADLARL